MTRRCAISFFYDNDGIVDDYIPYLLNSLRPHLSKIIFVVNGDLTEASRRKIKPIVDEIIIRQNVGFDVWAYKEGLDHIRDHYAGAFDEVVMFNHTFFGPLYPASEIFEKMEATRCDFWGLTAHKKQIEEDRRGKHEIPFHLNSYFISVREPMLSSDAFRDYWATMPMIETYQQSIHDHELRFTRHFQDLGYVCGSYMDPEKFGDPYPAFTEVDATIAARSPVFKRRSLFNDPIYQDERGIDVPRALRLIEENTDYDVSLIWKNLLRSTPARTLNTNAANLRVLPDLPPPADAPGVEATKSLKIAVCAHIYYVDMIDEILDYAANIPIAYDLVITTDTKAKISQIEQTLAQRKGIGKVIIRQHTGNGRDVSSLLVTCHDLFCGDRYDLVCRVHTKKSPQVGASKGSFFKRFVLDSALGGRGYVENLLALFGANPELGIVMPPMLHITTPALGHAWFINRQNTIDLAQRLRLTVPIDDGMPIAPFGGMFWFRPKALRRLYQAGLKYTDFAPEPLPIDGSFSHAVERIFCYVAQEEGYYSMTASTARQIEHSYVRLEYKTNELTRLLPTGDIRPQLELLRDMQPQLRDTFLANLSGDGQTSAQQGHSSAEVRELQEKLQYVQNRLKRLTAAPASGGLNSVLKPLAAIGMPNGLEAERRVIRDFLQKLARNGGRLHYTPLDNEIIDYLLSRRPDLIRVFDSHFYMQQYPDIVQAGVNPLVHFLTHGWQEGRSPHPLIDPRFIAKQRQANGKADVPMLDILNLESRNTVSPHPLFDTPFYLAQVDPKDLGDLSPLEHYLVRGSAAGLNPHPLFDNSYYAGHSPELVNYGITPLAHYVRYGGREGRNPCATFNSKSYYAHNPDVRQAGTNPLAHYVLQGRSEGRHW